tara:strand:- start:1033 stop:1899 length:867 start_codon:yes stop_codon:yes gene_type:complete
MFKVSAKELLSWLRDDDSKRDYKDALYLLLDLLGGLSQQDINSIKIDSSKDIYLKKDLDRLDFYWSKFKNEKKPIQYLCGETYWRDFKLKVSSSVLIPRKETEQIVDIVMDICRKKNKILFTDLGTGSGAIAIALAVLNPKWKGLATDINKKALNIARENSQDLCKYSNLEFYCGNWWKPLINYAGMIDVAVSNPPYIPNKVFGELSTSVKKYEPEIALKGGKDGLSHIEQIIKFAPHFLRKGGWLILENHFDQSQKIATLFKEYGFKSIEIINDYSGIGRFTIAKHK